MRAIQRAYADRSGRARHRRRYEDSVVLRFEAAKGLSAARSPAFHSSRMGLTMPVCDTSLRGRGDSRRAAVCASVRSRRRMRVRAHRDRGYTDGSPLRGETRHAAFLQRGPGLAPETPAGADASAGSRPNKFLGTSVAGWIDPVWQFRCPAKSVKGAPAASAVWHILQTLIERVFMFVSDYSHLG